MMFLNAAVAGQGGGLGEAVLAEARAFVDWTTLATNGNAVARNLNDARAPSRNLIAFPTGPIVNEAGSANPPRTNFYTGVPDPSGVTNNATRILTTSTNQVLYLHRASTNGALPAGTYTLRFRARANTGTGPWSISFGNSASYASGTVQDLDWSNPSNESATTFTATFTNPANDIAIRFAASGADVIIDRLQLYEGSAGAVPAWSSEVFVGGRQAFAYANSVALDGSNNADLTGKTAGLLAYDPAFPAKHAYDAYTVLTVSSMNAVPSSLAHLVNFHPNDGATSAGNTLQVDGTSPFAGEVNSAGSASTRSQQGINAAGDGLFVAGHGRSASEHYMWFDTIPAVRETDAFAGIDTSRWTIHSWTTTNVSQLRSFMADGKVRYTVIWDRLLTTTEYAAAVEAIRTRMTSDGVSLLTFTDYHVISGDSNSTRATGDWTQLVTADGYFSPGRNLFASITSVGGQGLPDLERDYSGSEAGGGLTDETITANGRFGKKDLPALVRAADDGRYGLYHLPIGTNDWDVLDAYAGTNADKVAAYCARLQAFINHVLSNTPARVHVMWYSLLPQTSTSRPNWETQRLLVNSTMATWIASQSRVHLCDFGGSATIGDRSLQAGGGGTYYQSDEIHFSAAGDTAAASIAKAAVEAWRVAVGI